MDQKSIWPPTADTVPLIGRSSYKIFPLLTIHRIGHLMISLTTTSLRYGGLIDLHVPLISHRATVRSTVPWYSDELRKMKQDRRKAECLWKRTRLPEHRNQLRTKKTEVNKLVWKLKTTYYKEKIPNANWNQKSLFAVAEELLHTKVMTNLPQRDSNSALA